MFIITDKPIYSNTCACFPHVLRPINIYTIGAHNIYTIGAHNIYTIGTHNICTIGTHNIYTIGTHQYWNSRGK